MKIKWLSHPNKPELNGTEQHVARELAHVAIGYGQAGTLPTAETWDKRISEMEGRASRCRRPAGDGHRDFVREPGPVDGCARRRLDMVVHPRNQEGRLRIFFDPLRPLIARLELRNAGVSSREPLRWKPLTKQSVNALVLLRKPTI